MTSLRNNLKSTDLKMINKLNIHKLGVAFFIIMGLSTAIWVWYSLIIQS
jgi:uncharacterized protein with PQ loop repeat